MLLICFSKLSAGATMHIEDKLAFGKYKSSLPLKNAKQKRYDMLNGLYARAFHIYVEFRPCGRCLSKN